MRWTPRQRVHRREQQPLGQNDGGETGPILPQTEEPFETEEPADEVPESSEPSDD